ncbi:MAG: ABC transporter substrate-binding protein, partial [Deltaproteobacteria bacterium]|nr:ABC transporter substrate-binding protein [Deltaproteobacteria bacterium]
GLVEGRDYRMTVRNAQADMPTLSALVDAAVSDGADMLLTLSTPTLQAAMQRGGERPIVFTFVADGVAAGAGKSNTDHRPNVTGVPSAAAIPEMLAMLRTVLPNARRLGTLFAPAEANSEYYKAQFEQIAPSHGFELVSVPVNSTAEASDAALSLLSKGVDAVVQIPGNLTSSAFASIAQPTARAGLPVFGFLSSDFDNGAVVVFARDYFDGGREAAAMAVRIMRGESPGAIPFEPLKATKVLVNLDAARQVKLAIPAAILQRAAKVVGGAPAGAATAVK